MSFKKKIKLGREQNKIFTCCHATHRSSKECNSSKCPKLSVEMVLWLRSLSANGKQKIPAQSVPRLNQGAYPPSVLVSQTTRWYNWGFPFFCMLGLWEVTWLPAIINRNFSKGELDGKNYKFGFVWFGLSSSRQWARAGNRTSPAIPLCHTSHRQSSVLPASLALFNSLPASVTSSISSSKLAFLSALDKKFLPHKFNFGLSWR